MAKVRWAGPTRLIDGDEARSASINMMPGDVADVSEEAARRLAGIDGITWLDAPAPANTAPVPAADKAATDAEKVAKPATVKSAVKDATEKDG
jgi:hypothetical protein